MVKERFQKLGEWKKLASNLEEYESSIVAVLSIQNFSNFALYVIDKLINRNGSS